MCNYNTSLNASSVSYIPSSVVCLSVGLTVTLVTPTKKAEPIKMPFGSRTLVGPRNYVLVGVQIPHGNR